MTYSRPKKAEKPVVWLHGEIKTPPFSLQARLEAGALIGLLQQGDLLRMPHSRPMTAIGRRVHELRINDEDSTWRVIYRLDTDAVIIGEVFQKTTSSTPKGVIEACRKRFAEYDRVTKLP